MAFTVTATQGGATSAGMSLDLQILDGQSGIGTTATAAGLSASITPSASNSLIYGSVLATTGAFTALSGTTVIQDAQDVGLEFGSVVSTSTTTGGTPETIGVTSSGGSGIATALVEIKTSGALTVSPATPLQPVPDVVGSTSMSTTAFSPPAGSLLVLMVQSNGSSGVTTISVSDTSGLGLTWIEQVKSNTSGNGYAGVWTATVPNNVPTTLFGQVGGDAVQNDVTKYVMGMQFSLSQSTTLTGIWFYSSVGANGLPVGTAIYNVSTGLTVSGSENLSPSWSGAAGSGWVKVSYSSGPTLAASTNYIVAILKDGTEFVYSATPAYWSTGAGASGLTSGIITAPNNASAGSIGQDGYNAFSGAVQFTGNMPSAEFNATNYWVDVEVTSSSGPPPTPPTPLAYTAFMGSM